MAWLYVLAIMGAILCSFGDVCATESARGHSIHFYDMAGLLAWAACYPVWRAACSATGGSFHRTMAAWVAAEGATCLVVAIAYREPMSRAKIVLLVGMLVFGVAREIVE